MCNSRLSRSNFLLLAFFAFIKIEPPTSCFLLIDLHTHVHIITHENMSLKLLVLWLFLAFSSHPFLPHAQEIFYNGFQLIDDNLTLHGIAQINSNGVLMLTNSTSRRAGHAFYGSPVRMKASPSSSALTFSTVFAFSITNTLKTYGEYGRAIGGHGLAFAMAADKLLNGALPSQYLGLFNATDIGNLSNHVFAVEFDTVMDFEFDDINDNHVGIDINSPRSSASIPAGFYMDGNSMPQDLNLNSGTTIFAWIDYDSGKTQVDVRLALSDQKPEHSILSHKVDLSPLLNEFMYVGFSASTGLLVSSHYIMGWSFNVNRQALPLVSSTMPTLPNGKETKNRHIPQVVAISASVLIFLMLLCSLWLRIYKKKTKQVCEEDVGDIIAVESLHMEFNVVRAATQNFAIDRKLGEGGFGEVYKGTLENGQDIAVKRLSGNSCQGIVEFKTEIALVAKLQHRNLVKLLGFCVSGKEKILVYEFLPNFSLDKILLESTKRMSLNWETRFNIIYGIAKGLLYLHEDSRLKIVHRDLKSSNILLDEAMNPKISDFGLAKLFSVDQTQDATKTIVGTYGYMAPEYKFTGHYSVKSDAYSFGVMVLEVVTGQRNNMNRLHNEEALLYRAWRLWNESAALNLVDETLGDKYSREEVIKCIHIGLLCIEENATNRPNMTTVVASLGGQAIALPLPSPAAIDSTSIVNIQSPPSFSATIDSTSIVNISVWETSDISELYPR